MDAGPGNDQLPGPFAVMEYCGMIKLPARPRSPSIPVSILLTAMGLVAPATLLAQAIATVGDDEITRDQFEREVYMAARQTYYHGAPSSEAEYIEFRREIADRLVDRALLLQEADRRGIQPDRSKVEAELAGYEARYAGTERWEAEGEQMMAALRGRFEQDSALIQLEMQERVVPEPAESDLRDYYRDNPEKFTEPAQNRVSVILLAVEAAATPEIWSAAREEAARIVSRLDQGADFAELARMHSSDRSADGGGDMGYLHAGMLGADVEAAIAGLDIGEYSEPMQVLEGMAIFRLSDRKAAQLKNYEDVATRAVELWKRDAGERQWQALLARLRETGKVTIDEEYLATRPGPAQ